MVRISTTVFATLLIALLGVALVFVSLYLNHQRMQYSSREIARIKGESIYHMIMVVRQWNTLHGGVYVPVTDTTQPNPFLEVPSRDIVDPSGRKLTLLNPAYMIRQISDTLEGSEVEARLVSFRPVNQLNMPDEWETQSLLRFEAGDIDSIVSQRGDYYHYIAPLYTKKACLKCHARHGYSEGQVRGALSVRFPVEQISTVMSQIEVKSVQVHWIAFSMVVGLVMILFIAIKIYSTRLQNSCMQYQRLEIASRHDGLTGALNHAAIVEVADHEVKRAQRQSLSVAFLMIDLDHFKNINDRYGHQAGDAVLRQVNEQICSHLREVDYLGRYGGEEFLVILPDTDRDGARLVAERIRSHRPQIPINRQDGKAPIKIMIRLSIGVAELTESNALDSRMLIGFADQALYQAKRQGRDQVRCYIPG